MQLGMGMSALLLVLTVKVKVPSNNFIKCKSTRNNCPQAYTIGNAYHRTCLFGLSTFIGKCLSMAVLLGVILVGQNTLKSLYKMQIASEWSIS